MKHLYKHTVLLIFLCCSVFAAQRANAQGWVWGKEPGGTIFEGFYICADQWGNVYGAGEGGGSSTKLIKYDSSGHLLWTIGTTAVHYTSPASVAVDNYGNVYLLGIYDTTFTFGSHTLTAPGPHKSYYFISKIDTSGAVEWVKEMGNAFVSVFEGSTSLIATDDNGSIYLTVAFSNKIVTLGSFSLTNADTNETADILVAKLDSSGSAIWAKSYGGRNSEVPYGLSVTPHKNIYLAGYTLTPDTLTFGTTTITDTGMFSTGFIAKLDSNGNSVWANGIKRTYLAGVASSSDEDVAVTGVYAGDTLTIGTDTLPKPPTAYGYGLVAKFDSTGNASWAKVIQGNYVNPWVTAFDPCSNVWVFSVLGNGSPQITNDTVDGHIVAPPTINGEPNFIAGWSNAGTYITASAMASGSTDDVNGMTIDKCGNIYVIADQEGCDTMIVATDTFISSGEWGFIAKYNPNLSCGSCGSGVTVSSIMGDSILCKGDTTTLIDTTTGGTWSSSNPSIATVGPGTGVVTAFAIGTTTITYSVGTGYVTKTISIAPPPSAIMGVQWVCVDTTTSLSDSTVGGVWSSSNTAVATVGSSTGIVTGLSGFSATITYSISAGCYVTIPVYVNSLCNDAVPSIAGNTSQVSIFPNPATTNLTILSSGSPITQVTITNLLSQTVYFLPSAPANCKLQTVNCAAFPPGIYFVKVNGTEVRKFVKE